MEFVRHLGVPSTCSTQDVCAVQYCQATVQLRERWPGTYTRRRNRSKGDNSLCFLLSLSKCASRNGAGRDVYSLVDALGLFAHASRRISETMALWKTALT